MTKSKKPQEASPIKHFIGGWLGGSIACILLSPLEVIKTRLQSSSGGKQISAPSIPSSSSSLSSSSIASSSTINVSKRMRADQLLVQIVRTEGIRGLYRGLIPHLLGVGPSRAFYFGTYNICKKYFHQTFQLQGAPLHLSAAAIGSIVSSTVMSPVWVVKTRLQLQAAPVRSKGTINPVPVSSSSSPILSTVGNNVVSSSTLSASLPLPSTGPKTSHVAYNGMMEAFTRIYKEEGPKAFYRGLGASYLGLLETAIQFSLYGALKSYVTEQRIQQLQKEYQHYNLSSTSSSSSPKVLPSDKYELQRLAYNDSAAFMTSAFAKLVAALLTYPHEVLRTRMREQRDPNPRYRGVFQSANLIIKEEGIKALYGGLGVHMVRTVPNAAILLMVVERVVGGEV